MKTISSWTRRCLRFMCKILSFVFSQGYSRVHTTSSQTSCVLLVIPYMSLTYKMKVIIKRIHMKCLQQCLAHSQSLAYVSFHYCLTAYSMTKQ